LQAKLRKDPSFRSYGAWLVTGSPLIAELMGLAGYDFLVVDLGHSPIDSSGLLSMLQASKAAGVPVLVRVALNREDLIKAALDTGPDGLIVPLVNSAADARRVADMCCFSPHGSRRGACQLVRSSCWGLPMEEGCVDSPMVFCQVDTPAAVRETGEILAIDGIDGIFVSSLDLAAAFGHPGRPDHEDVTRALGAVEAAAAAKPGKCLAGFASGRGAAEMFKAGYRLVTCNADVQMLRNAACADVAKGREALLAVGAGGVSQPQMRIVAAKAHPEGRLTPAIPKAAPSALHAATLTPVAKKRPRE